MGYELRREVRDALPPGLLTQGEQVVIFEIADAADEGRTARLSWEAIAGLADISPRSAVDTVGQLLKKTSPHILVKQKPGVFWFPVGLPKAAPQPCEPSRRRPEVPAPVRRAVFARDGRQCVKCGAVDELVLDHIYPWSRGGPHTVENLRVLCQLCNRLKGDRIEDEATG